jgi:hypothetical protein
VILVFTTCAVTHAPTFSTSSHTTGFPELQRHGERGLLCAYPEWLIMLIGVLAVKCKAKSYVGIHRLSTRYWQELCGQDVILPPISESQLRER